MKALAFSVLIFALGRALAAEDAAPSGVYNSSEDFENFARALRQRTLSAVEPKVFVPTTSNARGVAGRYPWKTNIVTQIFHVGERGGGSGSAWDAKWAEHFGGYDCPDPNARRDFLPVAFIPRLNPFYVALPYNDVSRSRQKPEARTVIPWFAQAFEREGKSVCHNRWLAIRKGSRVCYAQWSDVGPFRSDHWQYVFGNDQPKPNANRGAGLSVSPAVRDFLGLGGTDVVDWKFVEARDVPQGPWARYGDNNTAAQIRNRTDAAASVVHSSATGSVDAPHRADGVTVIRR